ncbi:hypothetical protein BpHYR1_021547, partial [Brachionus plicatilis]
HTNSIRILKVCQSTQLFKHFLDYNSHIHLTRYQKIAFQFVPKKLILFHHYFLLVNIFFAFIRGEKLNFPSQKISEVKIRRKKNRKIKKSQKIFIQEKFSSLKNCIIFKI